MPLVRIFIMFSYLVSGVSIFELIDQHLGNPNEPETETVPDQEGENDIAHAEADPVEPENPRNRRYVYNLECTFETHEECFDFISAEGCWIEVRRIVTKNGLKIIFRCQFVKSRGKQCAANIYVLINKVPNDTTCELYRRDSPHTHAEATNKVTALSATIKDALNRLIARGLTMKPLLHELRRLNLDEQPDKVQVANYYRSTRKKIYGMSRISIEDMIAHCEQFSAIPEDIDEAFVLGFEHSSLEETYDLPDEAIESDIFAVINQNIPDAAYENFNDFDDDHIEDEEIPNAPWIRFLVTTKRLLQNSSQSKIICADATKKIVVQRYPVLVFGSTDNDTVQHFHLLGIMVSTFETSKDFEFGFKTIKNGMDRVFNIDFAPKNMMADAAAGIHNGFVRVYGEDTTTLMCYAHVMRAVDRRKFDKKDIKESIKKDIRSLHFCYSKEKFDQGCELFIIKWKDIAPIFIKYFIDYWIKRNQNWYTGVCFRVPSTNNGLESMNGSLKIHHTHFQVVGLSVFKLQLMDIVKNRSMEYAKDKKPFQSQVTITKKMMDDGTNLKDTHGMIIRHINDDAVFCIAEKEKLTEDFVNDNLDTTYESFDEFVRHMFDIIYVTFDKVVENWRDTASCICKKFAADFMCEHVVFVALQLNLLQKKREHFLPHNTKPGRPKNAGPALSME